VIFRTGDQVMITYRGRTVPGAVMFGSSNGKSLMLTFEAILDGHVGMMPVLVNDDGSIEALMTGSLILLARRPLQ
jgi:hypothetical protein